METVPHHPIAENLDPQDSGQKHPRLLNPFSTMFIIGSGQLILPAGSARDESFEFPRELLAAIVRLYCTAMVVICIE